MHYVKRLQITKIVPKLDLTVMPEGEAYLDQSFDDWVRRLRYRVKNVRELMFDLILHPEFDPDVHKFDLEGTRRFRQMWGWYQKPISKVYHVHLLHFNDMLNAQHWWNSAVGDSGGLMGPYMRHKSLRKVTKACAE